MRESKSESLSSVELYYPVKKAFDSSYDSVVYDLVYIITRLSESQAEELNQSQSVETALWLVLVIDVPNRVRQ